MPGPEKTLITNRQAAEIWGVSVSTYTSYVSRGQAPQPVDRQLGHPLYDRAEVMRRAQNKQRRRSDPDVDELRALSRLREVQQRLDAASADDRDREVAGLSDERHQLVTLLARKGFSNSFIARETGISRHAIRTHLS